MPRMDNTAPSFIYAATREEVASVMGITRQRVYELEQNALRKPRKYPYMLGQLAAMGAELGQMRAHRVPLSAYAEDE